MDYYFNKLASDELGSEDFDQFLKNNVINKKTLLEIIFSLKCKLELKNIHSYFNLIKPFLISCKLKRSEILETSHIFCEKCNFYVESQLCDWITNNSELFETEIYFFYCFFSFFNKDSIIELDLISYPFESFSTLSSQTINKKQTPKEKLKLLNTIVVHYERLIDIQ